MDNDAMLGRSKLVAFLASTGLKESKAFYEGVLGLRLVSNESPVALVFDANGTMLRVTFVHELHPAPFTVLGWNVDSIEHTVDRLRSAGVDFLRFEGMNDKDPHAIWKAPSGARVAWFEDPHGNVLSVTQFSHAS